MAECLLSVRDTKLRLTLSKAGPVTTTLQGKQKNLAAKKTKNMWSLSGCQRFTLLYFFLYYSRYITRWFLTLALATLCPNSNFELNWIELNWIEVFKDCCRELCESLTGTADAMVHLSVHVCPWGETTSKGGNLVHIFKAYTASWPIGLIVGGVEESGGGWWRAFIFFYAHGQAKECVWPGNSIKYTPKVFFSVGYRGVGEGGFYW